MIAVSETTDRGDEAAARALLRDAVERGAIADPDFDPDAVPIADADVLARLSPPVRRWWVERFGAYVDENGGFFTPPQREAIPHVDDGENCLVAAPTGSGKTLASFLAVLDDLFARDRADDLDNAVYCLYVSPLKSLANDIERNLETPLEGIGEAVAAAEVDDGTGDDEAYDPGVRQAIRHGDTSKADRQAMLSETPHVLNTTPETLAILLNSPKFKEKLRTVEYVIVDEIHSLAANKRGTHLAVSLERLTELTRNGDRGSEAEITRIGCSATVEPLDGIASFLVGRERVAGAVGDAEGFETRPCEVVDARFAREFDLELRTPAADLIHTPRSAVTDRFYESLHDLIESHENTLVFTNSRSGAERTLQELRRRFDYDESDSGCHHGSLGEAQRTRVEEGLKSGELDVVTTSTSLELGIDMPHLDLVVQVGSPKSVAALLQRVGRAGHSPGETVEGRVFALDRDELIECAALLARAEEGFVDRVFPPEGAYDVAAQHVYGMAINRIRPDREVREVLRRAHPYRGFDDAAYERLFRYLTGDYDGLEEKNVYPKVWRDANDPPDGEHHYPEYPVGETLVGKRGRLARVIYMTNVGTIPDSFTCDVFTRDDEWVGTLDESYLDTLESGDVFALGGERFAFRYRRGSKVYVDRTSERPTVPSWFAERLPLSADLAHEVLDFQAELLDRLTGDGPNAGPAAVRAWLRRFPLDGNAVRALARMYDEQVRYAGADSVSTPDRLVVEEELDRNEYKRRFYVHSTYGRRFNDGLSRLVAAAVANRTDANVAVAVADRGFSLALPLNRKVDVAQILANLDPETVREDLREAVQGTDLLQRYFRINAGRALLILKRYKGYEKSAAEQQVSAEMLLSFAADLEEFAVLEETYRELLEDRLDVDGIREAVDRIAAGDLAVEHRVVDSPSPLAFGLATLVDSDTVIADDESAVLREFHARVMEEIGETPRGAEVEGEGEGDPDAGPPADGRPD
ncbi:ATP-dependent helicase [Halorubrum sp. Atlit-8R]|uniref:ATP-dependent helicase n=1 Tax=unclassified Halorubrum TaxID=2642239 RepID=UPI000EF217F8|nr:MULTISPECIES: ATP-dependent helicase [unclassified Halorubrum]RLM70590.1 ATP-dependent helicase [Halorubrum sp. Atlit-9R]RLM83255.1 ATP-dependent helicase [Halorubrum sp. Atlit-8R]